MRRKTDKWPHRVKDGLILLICAYTLYSLWNFNDMIDGIGRFARKRTSVEEM